MERQNDDIQPPIDPPQPVVDPPTPGIAPPQNPPPSEAPETTPQG